ncbi:MAG TPA: type IX secretion system membrane protein PorP/SprF, partial [Chryseolinea sp.]|nr:type IX secretion system membrane protein PorP/SprF [Chryseolinea sp.]
PSVAGNGLGSLTFLHRQNWSGVSGAPVTNYLSIHTPFAKDRFGTGLNVFQEKVGVYETFSAMAAFAYHIKMTDTRSLSFGLSGEYLISKINASRVDVIDEDDDLIVGSASSQADFSFGITYKSKFFTLGAAANRLTNLTRGLSDVTSQFPGYYSAYAYGTIPLRQTKDLLEPMITYRGYLNGESQFDAGLYYTMNDFLILGGSYRTGGTVSATLGVRILDKFLIGYTRDINAANYGANLGSSNEITLRFDFNNQKYYSNYRNSKKINTQALALRRKTLSKYTAKGSPHKKSQHYKSTIRRNYQKSPNYRLDSSKKLQTIKVKKQGGNSYKKKKYSNRRRK